MAAANANVGMAETAYYPTLTLSASAGLLSDQSGESFQLCEPQLVGERGVSQTAARFRPPRRPVRRRRAAYDATVAAYRQTVLSAFQEVEDDLSILRYLAEEAVQQQEAVIAAQQSLSLETRSLSGRHRFLSERHHHSDHRANDQQNAVTILQRR